MFDPRDDARDRDGREEGRERVYDERDRDDDPREGLMRDLDLPRGEERKLVVHRDRVYELDGEDSRTLAAVGAFRVVPEQDLDIDHNTLDHLRDEGLVETVDLGDDERGLTLTREGRDLLDSHSMGRDNEPSQAFNAGVSRGREVEHDSTLYATYRQEEARLRTITAGSRFGASSPTTTSPGVGFGPWSWRSRPLRGSARRRRSPAGGSTPRRRQGDPAEARPARRSVPVLRVNRPGHLQPSTR